MTGNPRSALLVSGLLAVLGVAVALDVHAVRVAAAVVGCLLLPGLGWARRLRLRDRGDQLALTVVLSLCSTAIVGTGMAVLGRWSPTVGGLILAAIAVLGFVPVQAAVVRVRAVLLGRPVAVEGAGGWVVAGGAAAVDGDEDDWKDWYADARRRSDEEHRLQVVAAAEAEREWRDWYDALQQESVDRDEAERERRESRWTSSAGAAP